MERKFFEDLSLNVRSFSVLSKVVVKNEINERGHHSV